MHSLESVNVDHNLSESTVYKVNRFKRQSAHLTFERSWPKQCGKCSVKMYFPRGDLFLPSLSWCSE